MARLQKQDEEFCRRLRAAIETGRERCPATKTQPAAYMKICALLVPREMKVEHCAPFQSLPPRAF
jgi:hypothetical protein